MIMIMISKLIADSVKNIKAMKKTNMQTITSVFIILVS